MGYKHTFEIITKDIQDIEKLVGNFENYSEIPPIELDLALSKLRNVYEILLMFRNGDNRQAPAPPQAVHTQDVSTSEKSGPAAVKPVTTGAANPPETAKPMESNVPEPNPVPEPVAPPPSTTENTKTPSVRDQEQPSKISAEQEKKILAEKLGNNTAHINEKLGENARKQDISSRLQSSPITSISGSMGINDKFFFIRELFNGDADKFRATMDSLEHATNYEEAFKYLSDNFGWNMEGKEVKQLLSLIHRKFINS